MLAFLLFTRKWLCILLLETIIMLLQLKTIIKIIILLSVQQTEFLISLMPVISGVTVIMLIMITIIYYYECRN